MLNEDKALENKNEKPLTEVVIPCQGIGGREQRMTQTTLSQEKRHDSFCLREEKRVN